MYAFVALDLAANQFLAARDPYGEKPLYVIQQEGGFLFCSEIRPLLRASETGEALLVPPGYALTRNYCKPYAKAPAILLRRPHRVRRANWTASFRPRCRIACLQTCRSRLCSAAASTAL